MSTAANVSLGYLSEIERGQKEASSELLAAICDALGVRQSEVLQDVTDTVALAEEMAGVLTPVPAGKETEGNDNKASATASLDRGTSRIENRAQGHEVVYAA